MGQLTTMYLQGSRGFMQTLRFLYGILLPEFREIYMGDFATPYRLIQETSAASKSFRRHGSRLERPASNAHQRYAVFGTSTLNGSIEQHGNVVLAETI
jgi:hypothetical protein